MKLSYILVLFICLLVQKPVFAQLTVVYPDPAELRTTLQALAQDQHQGFQYIKGSPLDKRGTTQYYSATRHIVPADTPKVCEDTNPLQVYYMDFVAKGMTKERSQEVYKKWQELIKLALPGCSMQLDGTQYPDLESLNFVSADGGVRFTLYRNGTGNGCQVSISFMHKGGWNAQIAGSSNNSNTTQEAKAPSVDAEGVKINSEEFARQLNQLILYAKTGFKDIKGAKAKSEYVDKYSTSYKMSGTLSQEIVYFPFLGISYCATYMEGIMDTRGNDLFDQLRKLTARCLPTGFTDEGVKDDGRMRTATFSTNNKKLFVEITRSLITHTLAISVRDKSKY